ncbi:MAG: molybdenum cofactor guanylyltransferase [Pontibacterium sp.]
MQKRRNLHATKGRGIRTANASPVVLSGLVLAGGAGRRMLGRDKGLMPYKGQPLVAYATKLLSANALPVTVSHNRSSIHYQALGVSRVCDQQAGFLGPLQGLNTALAYIKTTQPHVTHVVTLPCDTPHFDSAALNALIEQAKANPQAWVVAQTPSGLHPIHGVFPLNELHRLEVFIATGKRRLMAAMSEFEVVKVLLPEAKLKNVNYLRQLR